MKPDAPVCSHCGATLESQTALCPHCGAALSASGSGGCLIIGTQIFLGLLALVFGFGGACYVIANGIIGNEFAEAVISVTMALLCAAACIWGIFQLGKRRK